MNRTASKERELPKRGKPTTYRRIVTANVNGKAVVHSDEPLRSYQFKTVPGYEHTLHWVNAAIPDLSKKQRFDNYPDSVVPGPGGTSLHFVTFPPGSVFADPSFDAEAAQDFDPRTMPMNPMSVEQCVSEGLNALRENRSRIVPGRLNRFMDAFVPAFAKRTFTAKMLGKALASKSASARAEG